MAADTVGFIGLGNMGIPMTTRLVGAGVPAGVGEAVVATWEAALADLPPDADHTAIARWLNDRTES